MSAKKVLIVDEGASFGGSMIVACHLVNYLDKNRYSATFVCEVEKGVLTNHVDPGKLKVIRHGFNYVRRAKFTERVSWVSSRFVKKLLIYTMSTYAALINLGYHWRLRRLVRRTGTALIHTNNSREAITVGKNLGLPVVWHLHGPLSDQSTRSTRLALWRVDKFIAISEYIADTARNAGVPDDKLVTIPNPCIIPTADLNSERRTGRINYGINADALVFGIVGRIVPWKGHQEFLLATEQVLADVPGSVAVIVGDAADFDTGYEQEIRKRAAALAHADRIVFTGYTPDMLPIYAMLDVLVHASIEPEPFGLVITEAMAHGVAVIAADIGAPKEIIEDGFNGFLVNPRDTKCMANTIKRLLCDVSVRERITETARRKVEKEYDPARVSASVAAIYDTLCHP